MTFKEFIAHRKIMPDAAGDAMRLAAQDPNLPEITTPRELQAYLEGRGLPERVTHSADAAWRRYREHIRKAGRT